MKILRSEILLEGHHIELKSAYRIKHGIYISFSPFNDLLEEAYQVLYCVDKETAMRWIMEGNKKAWLEKENKPLHRIAEKPKRGI